MRISSADWFKAGVARQRDDPISLGISPRACTILSKLLLLLLLLQCRLIVAGQCRRHRPPRMFSLDDDDDVYYSRVIG